MGLEIKGVGGAEDRTLPGDWDQPPRDALIHQVVKSCEARTHIGGSKQKTRAEVSGGGKKPWQQKRTGRACAGSSRGPIWRKGGVTFAKDGQPSPLPKVNRKMFRGALRDVLVDMVRDERVVVAGEMAVPSGKSKDAVQLLSELGFTSERTVVIVLDPDDKLCAAMRNIPLVQVLAPNELTPYTLLRTRRLIFSDPALSHIEEWLK